jgi:very-short-patch-repair endonuclease
MANLILPGDPEFNDPKYKEGWGDQLPPKEAMQKRVDELNKTGNYGSQNYAMPTAANTPFSKTAQSSSSNTIYTNPMWFSPLHTPQNWQTASRRREVYQWCRFFYECFTPENLILMADGTEKEIEKITEGDLIISGDGSPQRVKQVFKRWTDEKIMNIRVAGTNKSIRCTNNHEIPRIDKAEWEKNHLTTPSARRKNERKKQYGAVKFVETWSRAGSLSLNSYLFTPATKIGKGLDWSNEKCYVFGAFAAEGSYYWYDYKGIHNPKGIRFTVHSEEFNDTEQLFGNKITNYLNKSQNNKVSVSTYENGVNAKEIRVSNTPLSKEMYEFCGKGAKTKVINENFINQANKEQLLSFLSGFIDGDGCYNKTNGCQIITHSNKLASQLSFICEKLGLTFSHNTTIEERAEKTFLGNNIRISRHSCEILEKYSKKIQPSKSHHVKFREYLHLGNRIYRKVNKIAEERYTGWVYDLEIENIHSYCVNRCVVHNSEPKVAAGIDFYSQFPINGMKLVWPDGITHSKPLSHYEKLLRFYDREVKRLDLVNILKQISSEYFMLGDVFVHTDIGCSTCHGSPVNPLTGETCNHPGGTISRVKILNPDWIEVVDTIFADEPKIVMIPDDQIIRIVSTRQPKDIYDRLPEKLKQLIMAKKPIPLSSRVVSHIKHMPVPYGTYGTSLLRRLFTTLAYKTKIMTANWIVAERLIIPIRVVKIGSDTRPASPADIAEANQMLSVVANDPNLTLVTHHNFNYEWYGASGKILQLGQELEHIDKEMLDGLMLNQALLNGEMCLTPDHFIETADGYKPIADITVNDDVLMWNDKGRGFFVYDKPKQVFKYDNVENIYEIKSGNKVLFKCTKDHKIIVRDNDGILTLCGKKTAGELVELIKSGKTISTLMKNGLYIQITSVDEVKYGGSVYCLETKTGTFVAKYDGFEFVSSNSGYQSAQVGVEVLIRRIEAWRNTLANWVEEKVFRPIAQMKGLIDEEASEQAGEKIWLYPSIKWNDLNLKDKTQYYQLLMQLHDKQVVSTQTLCEELDLNYDQEIERLRYEMAQAGPMGAQLGAGGGGMGGLGGMGGGGGGGISAPGGGAAPPEGMGGMPGGGMPGGDMGGGAPGGAPGGGGMTAEGRPMKIIKKSKAKALAEQEEPMQYGFVKFTRIEQEFRKMLDNVHSGLDLKIPYYFQHKVDNPNGGKPYLIDFAFPMIKVGFEVDGSVWHGNPDQIKHDRERDYLLAMRGWTIVRFDDKTIQEKPEAVQNVAVSYIKKAMESKQTKKASLRSMDGESHYMTVCAEEIIDIYGEELPGQIIDLLTAEESDEYQ